MHQHRRSICRPFFVPSPFFRAVVGIIRQNRPVSFSAKMCNDQSIDKHRRHTGKKPGGNSRKRVVAPQYLAGFSIQTGQHPADAEGNDLTIDHCRRTSRPGVSCSSTGYGLGFVLVFPEYLCGSRIQTPGDLLITLTRKQIQLAAHQGRRGIAFTDGQSPLFCQGRGPLGRREKSLGLAVPVGAAPLRPILCRNPADTEQKQTGKSSRYSVMCAFHRHTP